MPDRVRMSTPICTLMGRTIMVTIAAPTGAVGGVRGQSAMVPSVMVRTGPVPIVPMLNVPVRRGVGAASAVPRPAGVSPTAGPGPTVRGMRSTMPKPSFPAGPLLVLGPTTTAVGPAHPLRATGAGKA